MKHPLPTGGRVLPVVVFTALLALAGLPTDGAAQLLLERSAVSGGASDATGGGLHLRATVGEAGVVGRTSGAAFSMGQGFWANAWYSIASTRPEVFETEILVNALSQSFPNPFRKETAIPFAVARPAPVRLIVYDVTGRRVATLVDRGMSGGRHRVDWSGRNDSGQLVASGIYFYRLDVGSWSATRRMLKLR